MRVLVEALAVAEASLPRFSHRFSPRVFVRISLTDVENQIWLKRNVFWWSLLPLFFSLLAFIAHINGLSPLDDWWDALGRWELPVKPELPIGLSERHVDGLGLRGRLALEY